jgi:hypothetical protein
MTGLTTTLLFIISFIQLSFSQVSIKTNVFWMRKMDFLGVELFKHVNLKDHLQFY